jgi:hypothetical protein
MMQIEKEAIHAEMLEWLASKTWTHSLTLVYNDGFEGIGNADLKCPMAGFERLRRDLRGFATRIDKHFLGHQFYRRPADQRVRFIAFVEGVGWHPHAHLLLRVPSMDWLPRFNRLILGEKKNHDDALWRRFAPNGSQKMRVAPDFGAVAYAAKGLRIDDRWIDSGAFHSIRAGHSSPRVFHPGRQGR